VFLGAAGAAALELQLCHACGSPRLVLYAGNYNPAVLGSIGTPWPSGLYPSGVLSVSGCALPRSALL
jgi:hypothetical protein